jgi:hypothetical protein
LKLLHPLIKYEISDFLKGGFVAQRKFDGVRLALCNIPPEEYGLTKGGIRTFAPSVVNKFPPGMIVDGELLGKKMTWESAQSALTSKDESANWIAFDRLDDKIGTVIDRVKALDDLGIPVAQCYTDIPYAWELAKKYNWEGIVIRTMDGLTAWKIKFKQQLDVLVHRKKIFVFDDTKTPILLGSLDVSDGRYRIQHEGITRSGKLRAPFKVGPSRGLLCQSSQLNSVLV